MATNYTASTITIFLNVVKSYFWRLNSFLIQFCWSFHVCLWVLIFPCLLVGFVDLSMSVGGFCWSFHVCRLVLIFPCLLMGFGFFPGLLVGFVDLSISFDGFCWSFHVCWWVLLIFPCLSMGFVDLSMFVGEFFVGVCVVHSCFIVWWLAYASCNGRADLFYWFGMLACSLVEVTICRKFYENTGPSNVIQWPLSTLYTHIRDLNSSPTLSFISLPRPAAYCSWNVFILANIFQPSLLEFFKLKNINSILKFIWNANDLIIKHVLRLERKELKHDINLLIYPALHSSYGASFNLYSNE